MSQKFDNESSDYSSDTDEIVLSPKKKILKKPKKLVQKKIKHKLNVVCKRTTNTKNLPKLKTFVEIIESLTNNWYILQCQLYKDFDFYFIAKLETPNRSIEFNISGEFDEDELEEIKETLIDCLYTLKFMNMKVVID